MNRCRHEYHVPTSRRSDAWTERSFSLSKWESGVECREADEDYTKVGLTGSGLRASDFTARFRSRQAEQLLVFDKFFEMLGNRFCH